LEALRSAAPTRRAVLGGSAAVLATVTGCTTIGRAAAPAPGPQVSLLDGAIQSEAGLIALYDAVLATHPRLAGRLQPLRDHHAQHLAVLKRHYVPGTNTGTTTPAPRPTATAPAGQTRALTSLRSAERKAAAARADEVRRATPGLAQLLASIGACEAGHAQVLT
jgi:hypothetical protein